MFPLLFLLVLFARSAQRILHRGRVASFFAPIHANATAPNATYDFDPLAQINCGKPHRTTNETRAPSFCFFLEQGRFATQCGFGKAFGFGKQIGRRVAQFKLKRVFKTVDRFKRMPGNMVTHVKSNRSAAQPVVQLPNKF